MGMFSWLTADDKKSIANVYSGKEVRPVYLLQPNGQPPIKESSYEGYGIFGDIDAYEWLAKLNTGSNNRSVGIFIDCGDYYEDSNTYYSCGMSITADELRCLVENKDKAIVVFENYSADFNEAISISEAIKAGLIKKVKRKDIEYPLKFSFDPNAEYEQLPASEHCPNQGFLY